jgi:hypothetical protein
VEAVEPVGLVRFDGEVEHARDGEHDEQPDEPEAEVEHRGGQQRLQVEGTARERQGGVEAGQRRDHHDHDADAADGERHVQAEHPEHLQGAVDHLPGGADVSGFDQAVVHLGPLPGRAVPALACGHALPRVQRRRVPELRAVTHRGLDVEHRHLADDHVLAEGHGPDLDHARVGPVAVEVGVLADHRAVADRQQVGTHRHVLGEDRDVSSDLRAEGSEVEHVQR